MAEPVIGVGGLGAMGLGIAQVFASAGCRVLATDLAEESRATAPSRIAASLDRRVGDGKLTREARDATLARLEVVERPEAMAPADLVIEAIVEAMEPKAALFGQLDAVLAVGDRCRELAEGGTDAGLIEEQDFSPVLRAKEDAGTPEQVRALAETMLARLGGLAGGGAR